MDVRIFIFASNMLLASIVLALIGYFTGSYSIIGAAASIGTVGGALLVIGLGYREPSVNLMVRYCEIARSVLAKIAEDMGLASHTLYAFPEGDEVTIAISKPNTVPRDPKPLVGVGEAPYVAFRVRFEEPLAEVGGNALDVFRSRIVELYSVSRNVEVRVEERGCTVVFEDLNEVIKPLVKKPLSPVTITAFAELARFLNRKLQLVYEEVRDGTLELRAVFL